MDTSWGGSCEQAGLICCCGSCGTGLMISSGVHKELIVPALCCLSIAGWRTYRLLNHPDFHCCTFNRFKKSLRRYFCIHDKK